MKTLTRICAIALVCLAMNAQVPVPGGSGGSGGGGATITGSSVLKGSSGNGVAAAASDVVALFGSGSCSGYLKSDGTCIVASSTVVGLTASVSGNTLTIACPTGPCPVRVGDTTYSFTSLSATATPGTGTYTAYVYVDRSGNLTYGHNGTSPTMGTGITAAGSTTSFPSNVLPLFTVSVVSNSFSGSPTDVRPFNVVGKTLVAGSNITLTESATSVTVASAGGSSGITSGTADPSASCSPGALYYRTDTRVMWECTTTDTWAKVVRGAYASFVNTTPACYSSYTALGTFTVPANTRVVGAQYKVTAFFGKSGTVSSVKFSGWLGPISDNKQLFLADATNTSTYFKSYGEMVITQDSSTTATGYGLYRQGDNAGGAGMQDPVTLALTSDLVITLAMSGCSSTDLGWIRSAVLEVIQP